MVRYAIVEDGVVKNITLAESALGENWIASDTAGKGWTYDGGEFTAPETPSAAVPRSVSMRQARLALLGAGLLSSVETAIAGMDEPDKSAITIEWEYGSNVERASPWIAAMTTALDLTESEMDDLFIAATAL